MRLESLIIAWMSRSWGEEGDAYLGLGSLNTEMVRLVSILSVGELLAARGKAVVGGRDTAVLVNENRPPRIIATYQRI